MNALADALVRQGVRSVFGVTGSGPTLRLITALEDRGVPYVGATHEAWGAVMAGSFGRASGTLGCALSIKGPGLANMLGGLLSNAYEMWAVLSLSEAYAARRNGRAHKLLDQELATRACTKAYAALEDGPGDVVAALAAEAVAEPPGPVHLDLAAGTAACGGRILRRQSPIQAPFDSRGWGRLLTLVERSRRAVVIVGSLGTRAAWGDSARGLRVPVLTTVAAKGLLDEASPYAAGILTGDGKGSAPECAILQEADLVVGVGLRSAEVLTPRPFSRPTVLLDVIDDPDADAWAPDVKVTGARSAHFVEVLEALGGQAWGDTLVAESVRAVRHDLVRGDWSPGGALQEAQQVLPVETRLVVDTGSFCTVAEHVWIARDSRGFMGSTNGRYMGTGIPMAIGAAFADRRRPILCAIGDGGIRVAVAEMKLALAERLPVAFVLVTDGRYGSIADQPAARGLSRRATSIPIPSWLNAVDGFGMPTAAASTREDVRRALHAWVPHAGPLFIEARFDPAAYATATAGVR